MNYMQKIKSCMLLFCIESIFFAAPDRDKKERPRIVYQRPQEEAPVQKEHPVLPVQTPDVLSKIAPDVLPKALPKVAADTIAADKAEKKSATTTKESEQGTQLAKNFIHAVDQIKENCKSHQDKHASDHRKKVDEAFVHYKKLYDHFHVHKDLKISKKENDEITLSV